ncbi:unnamed protein product [Anisakis simplex]|uniref:Uncharacterized protein n=1 Tax=Anisakis simplex TaxID=6269 RepID=A0A3P6P1C0_ANISI|nr:unnamed protein product [Anisakis simplex]
MVSATEGSANVGLSECTPYREVDRRSFAKYVQLLKSEHFRNFIAIPAEMNTKLRWSPSSTRCTPREMTAEGALQHLKLGNFLRKRYSRSGWLQQTSTN